MPTIKWVTSAGSLTDTPLSERLTLNPPIVLDWAAIVTISWAAGPTNFVNVSTEGNISLETGWRITGNGIADNTEIVSYNSTTKVLELSNVTLTNEQFNVEGLVRGNVFAPTTLSLISGSLPRGLRLSNNTIIGTPTEVRTIVDSRFVLRLSNGIDTLDRTFKLTVEGPDSPTWATNGGLLPVGTNMRLFVLDNDRVDFYLNAIDPDIPAGDTVKYYIPNDGGELPPGLFLTETGRIYGFTDPIFSLEYNLASGFFDGAFYDQLPYDIGNRPTTGYDTFTYDDRIFDFSDTVTTPRRLNRYYKFTVAATDGIFEVRREFSIYVVTEDFLRADNDMLRLGTGLFTADLSSTIKPIWITESYLGRRRANNYITMYLDVYDPPSLGGTIDYKLLGVNKTTSGKVYGRTAKGANSIFVDLSLDSSGNFIRPVVGQKMTLVDTNSFSTAFYINGFQNVDANRYILHLGGSGALVQAEIQGGKVTSVKIINGGNNYLTVPTVIFDGGGGSGATGIARIKNGRIVGVDIIEKGDEYVTPPTISFGTVTETIFNGTDIVIGTASDLPPNMKLDSLAGEVTGIVPYQPSITKTYTFTIRATTTAANQSETAFADKTFTIDIIGELESGIEWASNENLGFIKPNMNSMLEVVAASKLYGGFVNYSLVDTNPDRSPSRLPSGLTLLSSGAIVGKVRQYAQDGLPGLTSFDISNTATTFDAGATTFDKEYTFTVRASDVFNFAQLDRTFTIKITNDDPTVYSNLYVKAFQKKSLRNIWYEFITDSTIFDPSKLYRQNDENFGVQSELKMLLYAGIESVEAVKFVQAMSRNHYRKRLRFGDVKKAVAKDPVTQEVIYEVVYVEMIDNLEKNGVSIESVVDLPDYINSPVIVSYDAIKVDSDIPFASDRDHQRIFPNSVKNMRNRVKALGKREREYLPLWMRSIQPDTFVETGFVKAVTLCYTKPGHGDFIVSNITSRFNAENEAERFDFKQLDFEIDRYVIDSIDGYIQDKYLVFPQRGEKV
jgi:hypothetical protein